MLKNKINKGFTLLEILLVIAAIGILAAIVLVAINPNRQLEAARNAKRRSDINTITKAIQQYSIDNNGQYPVGIETGAKAICRGGTPVGCIDLSILAPEYLASIPEPDSNYYYVRRSNNNIEVSHPRDDIWNIGGNPGLDLDFASNKSLIDSVSGNNLINFTRNSIGTYVGEDGLIKTAVVNEPRFDHDPTTGESLGLLVEGSSTNYTVNSLVGHTYNRYGISAAVQNTTETIAPDGTNTARLYVANGSSIQPYIQPAITGSFLNNYTSITISVYVKVRPGFTGSSIRFASDPGQDNSPFVGVTWNPLNYTSPPEVLGSGGTSSKVIYVGNGWFRCSASYIGSSITHVGSLQSDIQLFGNGTSDTNGFYLWGEQIELNSFPTSYIPTSGSAVTRTADNISINGANFSNFFNTLEGTFFADYKSTSPTNARILNFGTGATSTIISNEGVIGSGSNFSSIGNIAGAASNGVKVAATTSISESAGAFNSNTTVSTGETSYYTGATSLNLLPDISGAPIKQNWLKRITYWPNRLPNTTLQALTQ